MSGLIVGRESELAILRRAVDRPPEAPRVIAMHGDPGVGKSILLQATVAYAKSQGRLVLGGTGYEIEAELAFAGLHQLLAPVLHYLDEIEPYHRTALRRALGIEPGAVPDRLAICAAAFDVLATVAAQTPVVIAVEDSHWVDRPTRDLMMFLLMRLADNDISAVFTRRALTSSERVTDGITMLGISPLDDESAERLLSILHPQLDVDLRRRVLRDAAGNPLALHELPSAYPATSESGDLASPERLQTRLEALFAARVAELAPATRSSLLALALQVGQEDEGSAIRAVRPADIAFTRAELTHLDDLGLISQTSGVGGVRFRHPLVRSAIVRNASPDEVRSMHGHLASISPRDSEERMWHLALSTIEPDEAIAAEIERVGLAVAARGGAASSARVLRRAADITPFPAAAARRLQIAGQVASNAGELRLAEDYLDQARRIDADPISQCRAQVATAQLVLRVEGDLSGARRLVAAAYRRYRAVLPDDLLDAIITMLIYTSYYSGDAAQQQEVSRLLADHRSRLSRLTVLIYESTSGLHEAVPDLRARVHRLIDGTSLAAGAPEIFSVLRLAQHVEAHAEARPLLRRLIERERDQGAAFFVANSYEFAARDHYLSGDWSACERSCADGLALSEERGLTLTTQALWATLSLLHAARGDVAGARTLARRQQQWGAPRGFHLGMVARTLGLASLAETDYDRAYSEITRHHPASQPLGHIPESYWQVFDLTEAAVHSGRAEEARRYVASAAGTPAPTPRLQLLIAGAHALCADPSEASTLFAHALATPGAESWPFDSARIRLAFGEAQRRDKQLTEARLSLRAAADAFAQLGAAPWQRRADQELRATGVTSPDRVLRTPRDLTEQQWEVARLAASGLSNKDIARQLYLSPRTVSAHLYRIFPKLGITSRAALRDALERAE